MNQEKIGAYIAENRKRKNLTQQQLAKKLGVTNRSISNWENGKCLPDYELLIPLTKELDISITELINGEKQEKENESKKTIEKVIDFLKYIEEEKIKKYKLIGKITLSIGILIILSVLTFISSENQDSQYYIYIGYITSIISFAYIFKNESIKKIIILNSLFIISLTILLVLQDIFVITTMKFPPRYVTRGHSNLKIRYYETPFYDVYQCKKNMFDTEIIGADYKIIPRDYSITDFNSIEEKKYC